MATFSISALRTELQTDPVNIGYSALLTRGDDNSLTDLLNSLTVNATKATSTVSVGMVSALDMQQAVVATEYTAITQAQRDLWNALVTAGVNGISVSNAQIVSQVAAVWSATTTTRANLLALRSRACTRAEALWGEGIVVSPTQIYSARVG